MALLDNPFDYYALSLLARPQVTQNTRRRESIDTVFSSSSEEGEEPLGASLEEDGKDNGLELSRKESSVSQAKTESTSATPPE